MAIHTILLFMDTSLNSGLRMTRSTAIIFFKNIIYLIRMFILKPYPWVKVRLTFYKQTVYQTTEYDGFFKFEWEAMESVSAGWHPVRIEALSDHGEVLAESTGQIYVPHVTQYAFISDIDDTIMISHSATIGRRLRELFIKNPHTRKTFPGVASHYNLLALSHTDAEHPNPFFLCFQQRMEFI